MKKVMQIVVLIVIMSLLFTGYVHAGVWGKVRNWLTGEVLALVASTVLVLLGGALGIVFRKTSRTFREVGEFMTTIGMAIEDRRITRDELASIIKEGQDIFKVWE